MTAKGYLRGYPIEYINDKWVYSDTKESTIETWQERPCGYCGLNSTPENHDGCLGGLMGVMNACCGHGIDDIAYIQFMDGNCVRKEDAISIMNVLSKYNK